MGVRASLVAVAACLALTGCGDDPAPAPPDATAEESPEEYHSGGSGPPFLCERPTQ